MRHAQNRARTLLEVLRQRNLDRRRLRERLVRDYQLWYGGTERDARARLALDLPEMRWCQR